MKGFSLTALVVMAMAFTASAFAPPSAFVGQSSRVSAVNVGTAQHQQGQQLQQVASLRRQRSSVASVQTMSLFGLGGPELAIILIAAAFVLGPQKLAELGKDAGKIAGELKEVPKEFQKGLAEGETEAKKAVSAEVSAPKAEVSAEAPKKEDESTSA
mmetsp:Transcript_4382/g.7858  ORF Transcript_4382/g.7858 Transcript_4382/m.7858 type:complete len:157 (-) Transcript_4382:373-843(-)